MYDFSLMHSLDLHTLQTPTTNNTMPFRIDDGSDKVLRKITCRANKIKSRAERSRKNRKGRVNKEHHTTKVSHKPTEPKTEKATKSRVNLNHEIKKIDDEYERMFWEQIEIMEERVRAQDEDRLRRQREDEERDRDEGVFQLCKQITEHKDKIHNKLSWSTWDGDDDSWEEACEEQKLMESYDHANAARKERQRKDMELEREFQFPSNTW